MNFEGLSERLRKILEQQLAAGLEVGASVAVCRADEIVASVHVGYADAARSRRWDDETLVLIWSATKGPAAACALHALEAAGYNLTTRIAEFWPEFGQSGKMEITVGEALSHRAGLSAIDDATASVMDHDSVVRAIEAQTRLWRGRELHGYGPRVFGFLVDEIVRRVSGAPSLGVYWSEHFREPHSLDLWIGLPEDRHYRVAQMLPPKAGGCPDENDPFLAAMGDPTSLTRRAFSAPAGLPGVSMMNSPAVRSASIPSFGGITNAVSLARFYAGLAAASTRSDWISPNNFKQATTRLSQGHDEVLRVETCFSAGFMMDPVNDNSTKRRTTFGPAISAFGHPGAGGSLAFADPESGIGFAFVMNQMHTGVLPQDRAAILVREVYTN